ncbi:MAG: mntC [Rhodospirillales bacterium]|nr:mntC [Rhodospirillales bacterium]
MRIFSCLVLALAIAASANAAPLKLVASFTVLADLARQVGGDEVEVTSLVGPDVDAHGFEPRPGDARLLAGADLFVVNGLGFDPWSAKLARSSGFAGAMVVASNGADLLGSDPHAWQSVGNARMYAKNIADAIAARLPARADAIRARAARYDATLVALDGNIRAQLAPIPPERRVLITNHEAFDYFAKAYGLTMLAAQGFSTESEPSAKAVANLIREIKARKVTAVFLETMSNQQLMQRVARDTGVAVGGALYADALSKPDGPAATYVDMMRTNARTIATALAK